MAPPPRRSRPPQIRNLEPDRMRLYGELTKIEDQPDGTLKVYGVASSGTRDEAGEIVRPEAMKAALPDYARYPALREMHQPSAAGRTLEADVDADGATRIVAHVVDPVAVAKVKSKTYSGFSIGGKVLARDPADPTVITKIRLSEISLVDRPANPEAVIDLWKADVAEVAATPDNAAVKDRAAAMARAAGRPGAWKDYVAKARAALLDEAAPAEADGSQDEADDTDDEESGDKPDDAPDADDPDDAEPANDDLAGRLAALLGVDPATLQAAHDALTALGAACDPANCPELEKALFDDDLAKALPRLEALERRLETHSAMIERLAAAPAPPKTAAGAHARAIGKAEDADPPTAADRLSPAEAQQAFAALTPDERAHLLMKAALRSPIAVG
jgi:phage head maturation protease